jgi:hypothetical protein
MIEVKWELEGSDIDEVAAAAAVKPVLNYYKQALAGVSCPDHGRMPLLAVRGRTMAGLRVSVESCCPALQRQTDARMRRVSRRDDE